MSLRRLWLFYRLPFCQPFYQIKFGFNIFVCGLLGVKKFCGGGFVKTEFKVVSLAKFRFKFSFYTSPAIFVSRFVKIKFGFDIFVCG